MPASRSRCAGRIYTHELFRNSMTILCRIMLFLNSS